MSFSWADIVEEQEEQMEMKEEDEEDVDPALRVAEFSAGSSIVIAYCRVVRVEKESLTLANTLIPSIVCVKIIGSISRKIRTKASKNQITFFEDDNGMHALMPVCYLRKPDVEHRYEENVCVTRKPSHVIVRTRAKSTYVDSYCACRFIDQFFAVSGERCFVVEPLKAWNITYDDDDDDCTVSIPDSFATVLESPALYKDIYSTSNNVQHFIVRQCDSLYYNMEAPLSMQELQATFRQKLNYLITRPLGGDKEGWVRARVRKFVTRRGSYDYGFTRDEKYIIRSNVQVKLHSELTGRFLLWDHYLYDDDVPEEDKAHNHAIIFGYVPEEEEEEEEKRGDENSQKQVLHFFTEKSVDGFDALYTFLRTQGKHTLYKGKTYKEIVRLCYAREKTYDKENEWWVFAKERTIVTPFSQLMSAWFNLKANIHLPAVQHFMRLYMPVRYAQIK